jgi:hypothetical protein
MASLANIAKARATDKANTELLYKGALCALIGLAVLISPYFMSAPDLRNIVGGAALVGWFSLVLGAAFLVQFGVRRWAALRPR